MATRKRSRALGLSNLEIQEAFEKESRYIFYVEDELATARAALQRGGCSQAFSSLIEAAGSSAIARSLASTTRGLRGHDERLYQRRRQMERGLNQLQAKVMDACLRPGR